MGYKFNKAFAVSSNTAFAEMIHQGYKNRPLPVNRCGSTQMNQKLVLRSRGNKTHCTLSW